MTIGRYMYIGNALGVSFKADAVLINSTNDHKLIYLQNKKRNKIIFRALASWCVSHVTSLTNLV